MIYQLPNNQLANDLFKNDVKISCDICIKILMRLETMFEKKDDKMWISEEVDELSLNVKIILKCCDFIQHNTTFQP